MKQRFAQFYTDRYRELGRLLTLVVPNGGRVLDIGAGDGHFEAVLEQARRRCRVTCIESDAMVAARLAKRTRLFRRAAVEVVVEDANKFLRKRTSGKFDVIFLSSTLHELNTPARQRAYLGKFFNYVAKLIRPGGMLVVGDFYYPEYLHDREVRKFIEFQKRSIGHADAREKFINPELLVMTAQKQLRCVGYSEARATDRIDRRHYITVFTRR